MNGEQDSWKKGFHVPVRNAKVLYIGEGIQKGKNAFGRPFVDPPSAYLSPGTDGQ